MGSRNAAIPRRFQQKSFIGRLVREQAIPSPVLSAGARVVAVAGIASPSRFFDAMTASGYMLAETLAFADHHLFSRADARRIAASVSEHGATAIVTTSKDAIRLEKLGPWPVPLIEVPLAVHVEPALSFRDWLLASVARSRA